MAFVQKGIIATRYEGTVSWVSWRLWVSIFPIRGQWSFPTTSYIYIMNELESSHHDMVKQMTLGGKYLPNRLISGWRMSTMRPDYIAQCES